MGRKKLRVRRLECMKARQAKYAKRKTGVLKKAKELATLCDVDLALLMFSPTGKPSLYVGQNKDLSVILGRLSTLSVQNREERRAYTLKLLKKIYSKVDSDIDPRSFSPDRDEVRKLQEDQLQELKGKLTEKKKILRDWKNPQNVSDLAQIKKMEEHLIATLNTTKNKKVVQELQFNNALLPGALN